MHVEMFIGVCEQRDVSCEQEKNTIILGAYRYRLVDHDGQYVLSPKTSSYVDQHRTISLMQVSLCYLAGSRFDIKASSGARFNSCQIDMRIWLVSRRRRGRKRTRRSSKEKTWADINQGHQVCEAEVSGLSHKTLLWAYLAIFIGRSKLYIG